MYPSRRNMPVQFSVSFLYPPYCYARRGAVFFQPIHGLYKRVRKNAIGNDKNTLTEGGKTTAEAIAALIPELEDAGIEFVTVGELAK